MQNKGLVIIPKPQVQAKLKNLFNTQAGNLESDILFLVGQTPEKVYQQRWAMLKSAHTSSVDKQEIIDICNQPTHDGTHSFIHWLFQELTSKHKNPLKVFSYLKDQGIKINVTDSYNLSFIELAIIHRLPKSFFEFLIVECAQKIAHSSYLYCLAYLEQYLLYAEDKDWALEIKQYIRTQEDNILIQGEKGFDFAVVFNGNNKELLIVFPKAVNYMRLTFKNTLTNKLDILHMISKQGSELFFWGQALQYSPLALAVKLQCSVNFIKLFIEDASYKEKPYDLKMHAWFWLQSTKSIADPHWFSIINELLTNRLSEYSSPSLSLLHLLVDLERIDKIKELAPYLATEINTLDWAGRSPFMWACTKSPQLAETLFEMEPDVFITDTNGQLAINYLLKAKNCDLTIKLLKKYPEIRTRIPDLALHILLFANPLFFDKIKEYDPDIFNNVDLNSVIFNLIKFDRLENLIWISNQWNLTDGKFNLSCFMSVALCLQKWEFIHFFVRFPDIDLFLPFQFFTRELDLYMIVFKLRCKYNSLAEILFYHEEGLKVIAEKNLIVRFPNLAKTFGKNGHHLIDVIGKNVSVMSPAIDLKIKGIVSDFFSVMHSNPMLYPHWLTFSDNFEQFLDYAIFNKIIGVNQLVGPAQLPILFYLETHLGLDSKIYTEKMDGFLFFHNPNINLKNPKQEHLLALLFQQDNSSAHLKRFINFFAKHGLCFTDLNDKQQNILDLFCQTKETDLLSWFLNHFPVPTNHLLSEAVQTITPDIKGNTLLSCFESHRDAFNLLVKKLTAHDCQIFIAALRSIQREDILIHLIPKPMIDSPRPQALPAIPREKTPSPKQEIHSPLASSPSIAKPEVPYIEFNWELLKQYIRDANSISLIRALKSAPYEARLATLFSENNIYEIYELLSSKDYQYRYQFTRIASIAPYIADVIKVCIENDNLELFTQLIAFNLFLESLQKQQTYFLDLCMLQPEQNRRILDVILENELIELQYISAPFDMIKRAIEHKIWNVVEKCLPMLDEATLTAEFGFLKAALQENGKLELLPLESRRCESPPQISALTFSMFQPEQPGCVLRQHLPQPLIELVSLLNTHLQKPCILTGSAVANLFLKKPHHSDYDCLVLGVSLESLKQFLHTHGFYQAKIVGKTYPTLKLTIKKIEIEIATDACWDQEPIDTYMQRILANRDFTISALYLDLSTGHELLEVKAFDGALEKTEKRKISVVSDGDGLFEDAICLLRLIKISLQYPDFRFDDTLLTVLGKCDKSDCFNKFLSAGEHQAARISTFLETLFSRFPEMKVIDALKISGIFNALTGIANDDLEKKSAILEQYFHEITQQSGVENQSHAYLKKAGFFFFCTALYCHVHDKETNLEDWPFYGVIQKIKFSDRFSLPVLQDFIWNQERAPQYEGSSLYRMLEQFSIHNLRLSQYGKI